MLNNNINTNINTNSSVNLPLVDPKSNITNIQDSLYFTQESTSV